MAVGNVQIQVGVIVEIQRRNPPRPPRSRHAVAKRWLSIATANAPHVHTIPITHARSLLRVFGKILALQPHGIQPSHSSGGHTGNKEIQLAVRIIVAEGMRHAKVRRFVHSVLRHVREAPGPIVIVNINARKIVYDEQIKIVVEIQVNK